MEELAILTSDIARLLRREFDAHVKSAGLTRPQWRLLTTLRDHEGINQGELAELLMVEPITVCRMIDRLQDSSLIERRPDPDDRRSWRLHLGPRAHEILKELRPLAIEFLTGVCAGIPEAEQEAACKTLEKLRANLDRANRVEG